MNTELLDSNDFVEDELGRQYPTLGARFIAAILDVLIIALPIGLLSYANTFYMQSTLVTYLAILVYPTYKVGMEGTYGYTIGKKLQGFKIVKEGAENEQMDIKTSMLRYIFGFFVLILSLISTAYTFEVLVQGEMESFADFAQQSANAQLAVPAFLSTLVNVANLVYLVAILFIFQGVKRQPLYDRIAKTVCVVNEDKL
jgi:uncharacterized RDD family membrane protein YckC